VNSSNLNLGGGSLRVAGRRGEAGTRSCASLCISGWVRVSILAPSGGLRALCTDLDWVGRAIRAPHQVPETDTLKPGWMHDGRCIRCCEKKRERDCQDSLVFGVAGVCVPTAEMARAGVPCPVSELSRAMLVAQPPPQGRQECMGASQMPNQRLGSCLFSEVPCHRRNRGAAPAKGLTPDDENRKVPYCL